MATTYFSALDRDDDMGLIQKFAPSRPAPSEVMAMPVWDERHHPIVGTHSFSFIFGGDITLPDAVAPLPVQPNEGPAMELHVELEEAAQRAREIANQMQDLDAIGNTVQLRDRASRLRSAVERVLLASEDLIDTATTASEARAAVLRHRDATLTAGEKIATTRMERGKVIRDTYKTGAHQSPLRGVQAKRAAKAT